MYQWHMQIQSIVDEIDACIQSRHDEALTLQALSRKLGYSEFYTTRKFKEICGMSFRDYLGRRKLAFALKEVRDGDKSLLDIAFDYGFSSHEAFTRAFKATYGVTPSGYRRHPRPVVLRTKISPLDRYCLGPEETGMTLSTGDVKSYFVTIPAHRFMYIQNRQSNGYWDFWQRQNLIPGQDFDTVCGLLDSVKGKLDDSGGSEVNCGSGQIMAYRNDPDGRLCGWGIPRTECWGARLPADYRGETPPPMLLADVPEGEYLVFEHGAFGDVRETRGVEEKVEAAMAAFPWADHGCRLDLTPGRMMYFYYHPQQYFKYIRPIQRA